MANTIRLRRGSGAPSAGSFAEGEPAWDSTNGRLYVKNAAGAMVDTGTPANGAVTTAKVANDAVTYAKIQNVSATDKLLGRSTAGAGDIEEITCTAAGRALLDDADAAAQRTTLNVPTRTGGDASGTWGINISGNSATTSGCTFSNDAADKDNITTRTDSGFWQTSTGTTAEGWPTSSNGWHHLISSTHSNDVNYYAMQIAARFDTQDWYFRNTNGSGTTGWSTMLHSGNVNTYAVGLSGDQTIAGNKTFSGTTALGNVASGFTVTAQSAGAGEGGEFSLAKPSTGSLAGNVILDINTNSLRIFESASPFRGATLDITGCGAQSALLHSNNYNSYAPTLTGGNASGTWGINITGRGYPRRWDGNDINFIWSGQGGQPPWLWGGSDGANMYVYNPSNFSVNYANSAGSLGAQTFQGIGTYAICRNVGATTIPVGGDVAGSSLRFAGGTTGNMWTNTSSALSGTWRNMSIGASQNEYALFTRVS